MSNNWYIETELRRGTVAWPLMVEGFQLTFKFESEYPEIDQALKVTKGKLLTDCSLPVFETPKWKVALEQALECYNLAEEGEEDENPRNINTPKSEGTRDVQRPELKVPDVAKPVKIKKVNIGTKEEPKFASIGDYFDDETIERIANLLWDYQDLFPTEFTEMKGILGDLGVMKIPLKPNAKPVKQRLYRLNPKYKAKVKEELDKMIAARIIELVEESDWVSPMVVQDKKKKGEIRICIDLRKLNDASVHDPFPTPFSDEVLDNVGGPEAYSFIDGFSGYH